MHPRNDLSAVGNGREILPFIEVLEMKNYPHINSSARVVLRKMLQLLWALYFKRNYYPSKTEKKALAASICSDFSNLGPESCWYEDTHGERGLIESYLQFCRRTCLKDLL